VVTEGSFIVDVFVFRLALYFPFGRMVAACVGVVGFGCFLPVGPVFWQARGFYVVAARRACRLLQTPPVA
jgi:hypothetical protein